MAIASCRSTALISGLIAVNVLGISASKLSAEEPSAASFSFVSDEATAPIATNRFSSRTTVPKSLQTSPLQAPSLQKSQQNRSMRGRSASFRTDTTMTVVNNQNTSRKSLFGLNGKGEPTESRPPKQRKSLFSSWGNGGPKFGFFKRRDAKPNVDARVQGTSAQGASTQGTSAQGAPILARDSKPTPQKLPSQPLNSRTAITDSSVVPAAYNTKQRGGQLQLRSSGANRPTLFGNHAFGKNSKNTQQQRSQQQFSQTQNMQQRNPRNQQTQKQTPKPDAAFAAIESRQNPNKSVPNPLDKMFQRRGRKTVPKPTSNQSLAQNPRVQNRKQLTKPAATRKPTTPSPTVRKPADLGSITTQLKSPVNTRQQRSPGLALRPATPLRASQTKVPNRVPIRKPVGARSLSTTPVALAPQRMQAPLANAQPIAKPIAKPAITKPGPTTLTPAQQHVSKLIVEIHEKAQTAKTADEYTFILASCRRALAVEPKGELADYSKKLAAWALNRRGQLRADAGDDQHALLDFEDALKLDSSQWRALHNRAVLRAQTGDFERAFDDFNRCTELNPRFAKAYSNRGALFVQAGDLLAALQDYRRAIQLDPELAVAHKGRGRVCHMLGSLDESLYHFDAAMLLAPGDAHVVASRADLLADTGRYADAAAEYRRAIQMDEKLAHAQRSAAWLLATCPDDNVRDPAGALEFALKAIDLDRRENIVSLDTLAAAQANSGDFAAAITTMSRVLEMAPEKERSTYQYRLDLYNDSQPFRIQPVSAIQPASHTE